MPASMAPIPRRWRCSPKRSIRDMNYGEPTGWFTVTTPEQVNGNWVAEGTWKPQSAFDVKMAEQAAKQPKKKPSSPSTIQGRLCCGVPDRATHRRAEIKALRQAQAAILRRRATLRRPAASGSPQSQSQSRSKDDPDRPTLKVSPSAGSASSSSRPSLGDDGTQPASAPAADLPLHLLHRRTMTTIPIGRCCGAASHLPS